jgi:hypothetical protein
MGRLSQAVDKGNQGKLQGVRQSLQSVYHVLVTLAAAIYSLSPDLLLGVAAGVIAVLFLLFSKLHSHFILKEV